jgi:hypothetical protein
MMNVCSIVVLAAACSAGLPAAARADRPPDADALSTLGLRVAWPVSDDVPVFYAGERLVVRASVTDTAPAAAVSLVRVDGRGATLHVVARRPVRDGSTGVSIPAAGGRYRLWLDVAGRSWFSSFTARRPRPATKRCPSGRPAAADLTLSRESGAPGDALRIELRNTGRACLTSGRGHHWERRLPGGPWEIASAGGATQAGPAAAIGPGRTRTITTVVPSGLAPGPHRLVHKVASLDGPLVLCVPFEVTAAGPPGGGR